MPNGIEGMKAVSEGKGPKKDKPAAYYRMQGMAPTEGGSDDFQHDTP